MKLGYRKVGRDCIPSRAIGGNAVEIVKRFTFECLIGDSKSMEKGCNPVLLF